ncbi:hypothetical protein RI367_002442 [Sorochytrium milnesiophthora]
MADSEQQPASTNDDAVPLGEAASSSPPPQNNAQPPKSILKRASTHSHDDLQEQSSLSTKTERWLKDNFDINVDMQRVNKSWNDTTSALASTLKSLLSNEDAQIHEKRPLGQRQRAALANLRFSLDDDNDNEIGDGDQAGNFESQDALGEKRVRFSLPDITQQSAMGAASTEDAAGQSGRERALKVYGPHDILAYYTVCCQKRRVQPVPTIVEILQTAVATASSTNSLATEEQPGSSLTPVYLHLKGLALSVSELLCISDILGLEFGLLELTMDDVNLTDETTKSVLSQLYHINSLPWLSLANNAKISHAGVRYVSSFVRKMSAIRYLDLSGVVLDDGEAVRSLADALAYGPDALGSTLQVLRLDHCKLKNDGLSALAVGVRKSNLHTLTLCYNRIDPIGAAAVAKFFLLPDDQLLSPVQAQHGHGRQLSELPTTEPGPHEHDAYSRDVVQGRRPRGLVVLDLRHNDIKHGVLFMAEAMTRSTHLKRLYLSHNSIPPQGLTALAKALAENYALQELDLSNNPIAKEYTEGLGKIEALQSGLSQNNTLRTLNLANCSLSSHEIIKLCDALPFSTSLLQLNLVNNNIDMACLMALSKAMAENHSLISVELGRIPTGDECLRFAGEILSICSRNHSEILDRDKAAKQMMQTRALHELLNNAQSSSQLLDDMLSQLPTPPASGRASSPNLSDSTRSPIPVDPDTKELLEQLYKSCREIHEKLLHHISNVEAEDALHVILTVNDALTQLLARYTTYFPPSTAASPLLSSSPSPAAANTSGDGPHNANPDDSGEGREVVNAAFVASMAELATDEHIAMVATTASTTQDPVVLANTAAPLREQVDDPHEMLLVKRKSFEDEEGEMLRVAQEEAEQAEEAESAKVESEASAAATSEAQ